MRITDDTTRKARVPFDTQRWPFFYGWMILLAGAVGIIMSTPGQTMGVAVFIDPLITAVGLTRVRLSLAYMLGTVASSLILTSAGRFFDRYGARLTAFFAGLLMGMVLLALARVDRIAFALSRLLPARAPWVAGFFVMTGLFLALRFFGQGVMSLASRNMVMKWFVVRRGVANAVLGMTLSLAYSYAPRPLNTLVENYGWRDAWVFLALVAGGGFALFAAVFFRDSPEGCGLAPDGRLEPKIRPHRPPALPDRDYTLPEARRTYAYWVFVVSQGLCSLYSTALAFHIIDLFAGVGMTRQQAVAMFLPASIISVSLQFFTNWVSDYVRHKYILAGAMVGVALSSLGLFYLSPGWGLTIMIVGLGLMNGTRAVVRTVTWPRFFGRAHLGAIAGSALAWSVAGSALGPYLFSQLQTWSGSYSLAALVCGVASLLFLVATIWANNPTQTGAQ